MWLYQTFEKHSNKLIKEYVRVLIQLIIIVTHKDWKQRRGGFGEIKATSIKSRQALCWLRAVKMKKSEISSPTDRSNCHTASHNAIGSLKSKRHDWCVQVTYLSANDSISTVFEKRRKGNSVLKRKSLSEILWNEITKYMYTRDVTLASDCFGCSRICKFPRNDK